MIDGKEVIRKIIESRRGFAIDEIYPSPLSKLSWHDDDLDAPPFPVAPAPASPSATPSFDADHAWDMVVLAARASRYG